VLDKVVGTLIPIVRLPVTVLEGVESVLQQLTSVATRAAAVLDAIEGMPDRVSAVLAVAEPTAARIEAVLEEAERIPARIDAVLKKAEALTKRVDGVVAEAAATLASVQPAVSAIAALEPGLITSLIEEAAQGVPQLLTAVEEQLLPALASLEQLVPVVEHLGVQVDHLDATVADVGAMLGGIPGAARLLKRGATTAAGRQ
jgi:ABC-type transporter Mla subunit MlaD